MLFALYIFGLIITLGPAMLGFGLVVIAIVTSPQFLITMAALGFFYLLLGVISPKYEKLKELKKKNQLDKNSAMLYWTLRISGWILCVAIFGGLAYLFTTV